MSRSPFDPLADAYAAGRPGYPADLYDAIARLAGRPLAGATVLEIGAGTGIATRSMLTRGARVLALDVGPGMLARLRRDSADRAGLQCALADGHALPAASASADLVCAAQVWHWLDTDRATAEVARVLRPGGALAIWWNDVDAEGERWYDDQLDRLEAMNPRLHRAYRARDWGRMLTDTGRFAAVTTYQTCWVRHIGIDDYETWLRSKSYVAELGARQAEFLAVERASLLRAFPSGVVREPFRTSLWLARLPASPSD